MIQNKDVKIYLAGPWIRRTECGEVMDKLTAKGFVCTSTWIREHTDIKPTTEGVTDVLLEEDQTVVEQLCKQAIEDVLNLEASDVFVLLNTEKSEGKAFEFGYACAMRMPIIVVGTRERNIFYQLPHVVITPTVDECIQVLEEAIAKQNEFDLSQSTPKIITEV